MHRDRRLLLANSITHDRRPENASSGTSSTSSPARRRRCTTTSSSASRPRRWATTSSRCLLPTERVSEIKRGKKTETTRKFFPGYLIVNMWLLDENKQLVDKTWYFIKDTTGVIGFAGTKDRPIPMRQKEVDAMLAQVREREEKVKPKIELRGRRDRQGRRRSVPEPDRRRRGNRSRARQAPRLRQHLRPRDARRSRVLAGRKGVSPFFVGSVEIWACVGV